MVALLQLAVAGMTPVAAAASQEPAVADVVLLHGRIDTVDEAAPWVQALAIKNSRILAVGDDAAISRYRGRATRVIDLHGRLVTPGFIDSHVHFIEGSWYLKNIPLRDATTMAQIAQRIDLYAKEHPKTVWIQGEGWSYGYSDLPNGEFHKEMIDKVSAGKPVYLDSSMAHAAWVNSAALRIAGITRDTPNPAGGEIVRDANGDPTGWLKEAAAVNLVRSKIPEPSAAETLSALQTGVREANRLGLTRIVSAGGDFELLPMLAKLESRGQLTVRVSMADWIHPPGLDAKELAKLEGAAKHYNSEHLRCCAAKFLMDGVLESHTAYMLGGYADNPAEKGMHFYEMDAYRKSVTTLNQHGIQVYTHAIGDGAIKMAFDAYQSAAEDARKLGTPKGLRNRIEHAEAPDPEDISRYGQLNVIASMQPLMIYPRDEWKGMEGLWQKLAGPKFLATAFPLKTTLDTHGVLAFGTDWPVVQLNPLLGLRNAVLRQSLDGQPTGGYVPAQRISVQESLTAYTLGSAYGAHVDDQEGSIKVGKRADLAIFTKNFVEAPPEEIADAQVAMTLVGGKVVYAAP